MNFGLTEEQELLQQTVRDFAARECPPTRRREIFDGDSGFDPGLWKGLAEIGLAGLVIPEAQGGAGLELLDLALVSEVLGEHALPVPLLGHALASLAIARGGSDAQRERWLPRLASGEALGSVALCDEDGAWEPTAWRAATRGDQLSARLPWVPEGGAAQVVVVGSAGGGLAVVDTSARGVRSEPLDGVDRTRRLSRLTLDGAPCDALAHGAAAAAVVRDAGLVLLAADAFGAAWQLIRTTVDYVSQREQFNTPLAQFQSVKHALANLATDVEPARGLWWYAAHALDHIPDEAPRAAALAKAHVTDRAMHVAREAVELHGGLGFTWECDVQIWFKRCMFDRAFLGTPEVHRERSAQLAGWSA